MSAEPPSPDAGAPTPAMPTRRRWKRWLALALLLLLAGLLAGGWQFTRWALEDPRGTAWVLARLGFLNAVGVGIDVLEPQGPLVGDFKARRVSVSVHRTRVVVDSPEWRNLTLSRTEPGAQGWFRLHADWLKAERVTVSVVPGPPANRPARLPARVRLPLEIHVDQVSAEEVWVPGLPHTPFRHVRTEAHLGDELGTLHRFEKVSGQFESLSLSGHGRIGALAPMALDVQIQAVQAQTPPGSTTAPAWARAVRQGWEAQLKAHGPLARFSIETSVQAQGQQARASAFVEPISSWPLPQLEATTQGLDLSALLPQAPATSLTGRLHIGPLNTAQGASGGLLMQSEFTNARPGGWHEHLLPVRRAKVELRGRPTAAGPLDLQTLELQLADARGDVGQLRGSGHWDAAQFSLKAELVQVRPVAIDTRLPAMTLSGPVSLSGKFPQSGTAASAAASAPPAAGRSQRPVFTASADLKGRLAELDRAVQFKLSASGSDGRVEVHELRAAAGGAVASASGSADRTSGAWQLKGKAALVDFDPRPWFPGAGDAAWATGPHRVNLDGELSLTVPLTSLAPEKPRPLVERLAGLRGDAAVQLSQSTVAGEPLSGQFALHRSAAADPLRVNVALELAGNTVKLDGTVAPDARGAQDRWTLDVKAPAVARLAPVLRMLPAATASGLTDGLNGNLSANARLVGRWPDVELQGQAGVSTLKAGPVSLSRGQLNWQLGTSPDAPLELQAQLDQVGFGAQQLGGTQLQLKGSARAHELNLRTELKASPPAWVDKLQGRDTAASTPGNAVVPHTLAEVSAQGGLSGGLFDRRNTNENAAMPPWTWKGTVRQLELRGTQPGASPWISTRNVELDWRGGPSPRFAMSAGRADILTAGLRWDRIVWEPGQGVRAQQLDLQAELEPMAVAPLLQHLQPGFGWNGDLKIGGKVVIQQKAEFSADVVLERISGDLNVTDDGGTQALGLTDLVLALRAEKGLWNFTQGLAGKQLGTASGSFTVRTSPQLAWPDANAPLQGVLQAQVENLGTWGSWVPTGWRLGGQLRTTAGVSGRFGAPEYTGQVKGNDITVRNLLQGVNVTDGTVDVSLQGDTARINQFSARAGGGTVTLTGDAQLGAAPKAQLQLVADKFQLLGRVDRRIVLSGQGMVAMDQESLKVDGKFGVDEGLFDFTRADAPSLGSDVVVVTRNGDASEPTPRPGAAANSANPAPSERQRNTAINLQFDLGKRLRLRGRGIDTGLEGEVKIANPNGVPTWTGSVRAVDGTYAAYGQKLVIDRGVITFYGPPADPRLDILATRPNLDEVRVGVLISGSAVNPRAKLYSEPDMPDINKLSWLMLGRDRGELGTTDTALLQRAAMGLLAGDNPSVTDQVLNSIGIDDVSVRKNEGEAQETVVSLGKQLSRRWYVGYERGLNSTAGTWQLVYRVAQRFTLRAQSGHDNSLDVIWTWRWH